MTNRKSALVPFEPNRTRVDETLAALEAVAHLGPGACRPAGLDGREGRPPDELVAPNGLLDLRSGSLLQRLTQRYSRRRR